MKSEWKYFLMVFVAAITSNLYCAHARLDYLWSLVMGMGFPLAVAYIAGRKNFGLNELKTLALYEIAFIIPMTIAIEKVMLYYNSWGFSREHVRFIGVNIFGAPVEEYAYWWLAPVMVGVIYLCMRRIKDVGDVPAFLEQAFEIVCKRGSQLGQSSTSADATDYIEDNANITKSRAGLYSTKGETAFPTWIWIQALVVVVIIWLKHYFKGSWLTVMLSTCIFVAVAFLGERHAIEMGFWSYNKNRMVGVFFLGIPLEEYIMYFASAISECMMLDIIGRKLFKLR